MKYVAAVLVFCLSTAEVQAQQCNGSVASTGNQRALFLTDGGIALRARMNINIDGSGRAYHKNNIAGGGLIHLCNGGEVFLPNGTSYQGSESNRTCTGKFMADYQRIGAAGWNNPSVGAIRWFGVLGQGSATIGGRLVQGVVPVEQPGGSGYFVSPTRLADPAHPSTDQRRYIEPLTVPAAVVRKSAQLQQAGIVPGTAGVAIHRTRRIAVPFIVGDTGPRIGEGTPALARLAAGVVPDPNMTYQQRFIGQVDNSDVLWVFFGGATLPPPYDAPSVISRAKAAFEAWGGSARLQTCLSTPQVPIN